MPYLGNTPPENFVNVVKQDITGNGGQSYSLNHAVSSAADLEVFVNNVQQEPTTAYTVSGSTITFDEAVSSTDDIYVIFRARSIGTATHPATQPLSATTGTFTGDLTVDTNTLQVDATNNKIGINKPSTSTLQAVLHTHPSGTGSIPTNYLIQQNDDNLGMVIINTNDSATYSGLRIETRSTQAAGWLVANEFQSAFNGDLVFRARNAGSTSAEIARMKSSGGITFNGDTAAVNALDDYEEGVFTPRFQMGLTSPGYSVQQGTYVKIGSLVVCSVYLRANSGTENGDHIYVGGLPFTVITGGIDHAYGAFFTYNGGFWTSDANTQWLALHNQTNLAFYKQANGGAIQGTTSGVATNLNADLRLVAVYRST